VYGIYIKITIKNNRSVSYVIDTRKAGENVHEEGTIKRVALRTNYGGLNRQPKMPRRNQHYLRIVKLLAVATIESHLSSPTISPHDEQTYGDAPA